MVATKLIINTRIYELYLQVVNLFFAARFCLHWRCRYGRRIG